MVNDSIATRIQAARQSGAPDDAIFNELYKQNPAKQKMLDMAKKTGAPPSAILDKIISDNGGATQPVPQPQQPAANRPDGMLASGLKNIASVSTFGLSNLVPGMRSNIGDVQIGALKGVGSTIYGAGQLGNKIGQNTAGRVIEGVTGVPHNQLGSAYYQDGTQESNSVSSALKATNGYQTLGKTAEQIGEFMIPVSKVARVEKLLDVATQGMGKLGGALRVIGKAGVEGASQGGISLVQTGGDLKQAGITGLIGGAFKAATGVAGEIIRGYKLPERLYSTVFKNSWRDMREELTSRGITKLSQTNPEKFQNLVESGIIHTDDVGNYVVNESLAKKALDKGLRGSLDNMSDQLVQNTLDLEHSARTIARNSDTVLTIPGSTRLTSVLKDVASRYKNVGSGELAGEAMSFAKKVAGGNIDAQDALALRRFMDKMRFASSFDSNAPLAQNQANFKYWSDFLRGKIAKEIPGMAKVMGDYSFSLDALEALAKEATRRGNNQIFGLIDSALFGGGIIFDQPQTGIGLGVVRKMLTSPGVNTRLGSALNTSGNITRKGAVLKSAVSSVMTKRK